MKFFLRWTSVLATLIIFSLSSQVFASADIAVAPDMKAQQIEQALDNMADRNGDGILSEKEMKRRTKLETRVTKMSERMQAKIAKREAKGKSTNMDKIPLGLLLMGAGVVFYILAVVIGLGSATLTGFGLAGILSLLGSLSILIGLVFLIIGLVE